MTLMSLSEIWATFSSLITSLIAVASLIGGVWVGVGRPITKRLAEERRERKADEDAELTIRRTRETQVDTALAAIKTEVTETRAEVSATRKSVAVLNDTVIKHDTALFGKDGVNDQLSFLRGRESARTDIAQAASIAAAIVKETAQQAADALAAVKARGEVLE